MSTPAAVSFEHVKIFGVLLARHPNGGDGNIVATQSKDGPPGEVTAPQIAGRHVPLTVSGLRPAQRDTKTTPPSVEPSSILQALGAGVMVVGGDGVIVSANPHAARILHCDTNKLEGASIASVIAPLSELLSATAHAPDSTSLTSRGEARVRLDDESEITLGFSIAEMASPANVPQHVVLFQEISSIRELRKQRDRLLQMAVIGEVVPTLLHEMRNPLAAVTAMLEVLLEDAPNEMQPDLHAILSEVRRMTLGLQGIGGLVRSIHSSTHCAVDLAIRETCRLLEPTAERRGVRLEAHGPDLPLLPIDRGAICGVVFNLVKNAIDACPNGGLVTVSAWLEPREAYDELIVTVVDDGIGMSPQVITRCRELFFTTKDTGSGIGLALCSEITQRSGGGLEIQSELGQGTCVTLHVPAEPQAPYSSAPPQAITR